MNDISNILLVTDLDGTFFGKGARLVERNLAAVERFKAAGGRFTIATGRTHYSIRNAFAKPEQPVNAPIVFCNGSYLYDCQTQRSYSETYLSDADVHELVAFAREFPTLQIRVSAADYVYMEEQTRHLAADVPNFDAPSIRVLPFDTHFFRDACKVVFRDDPETLASIRAEFLARFGQRFEDAPSWSSSMEIMPKGVSKGAGIKKLRAHYAQRGESVFVIGCGDFENDLAMLCEADLAICPQNACDKAKRVAHAVLCHHDEGLIGDLIERLERGELEALAARTRGCDA